MRLRLSLRRRGLLTEVPARSRDRRELPRPDSPATRPLTIAIGEAKRGLKGAGRLPKKYSQQQKSRFYAAIAKINYLSTIEPLLNCFYAYRC